MLVVYNILRSWMILTSTMTLRGTTSLVWRRNKRNLTTYVLYNQLYCMVVVVYNGDCFDLVQALFIFQALAEEKAISEHNAQERDAAESRARQSETKSLSLSRELEEVQDKLAEIERSRKQLQAELDNLLESKDDVGKNVS